MSTDPARPSCKRDAETDRDPDMAPLPPPKRSKNASIMDYMRPQSGNKPQLDRQNREDDSGSRYLSRPAKPYDRAEQIAGGGPSVSTTSNSTNDRQQSVDHNTKTTATPNESNPNSGRQDCTQNDASATDRLTLHETTGDIFSAPPNTLLIHACNCQGSWGAGIAAAFRKHYPNAYRLYRAHCQSHSPDELFGTALLIRPQKSDYSTNSKNSRNPHFIGCLFTSRSMGRKKDTPEQILDATGPAMMDLMTRVREWGVRAEEGKKVEEVRMCKINSGLFAVPWDETVAVLEDIETSEGDFESVKVVSKEE